MKLYIYTLVRRRSSRALISLLVFLIHEQLLIAHLYRPPPQLRPADPNEKLAELTPDERERQAKYEKFMLDEHSGLARALPLEKRNLFFKCKSCKKEAGTDWTTLQIRRGDEDRTVFEYCSICRDKLKTA